MWPRNDGTHITPQGEQGGGLTAAARQAAEIAYLTALSCGDVAAQQEILRSFAQNFNYHTPNVNNSELDELDVTDSEFENDSEFDYELDSEQENGAVIANNNFKQNPHNNYNAPATTNIQSVSVNESNYNAVNALSTLTQLSALAAPNFSMPSQSVSNTSNARAVTALSQQSTPAAKWKPAPQTKAHQGNYVPHNLVYGNVGGTKTCDRNGNDIKAKDNVNHNEQKQQTKAVKVTPKRMSTNPIAPTECTQIRPRKNKLKRRETGSCLYEIQRRELEESFTSIESASPSRIKDMTASLKRLSLPRSNFSKISQFFHRNKTHPSHNLNNTLPEQRDSVTQPILSPQISEERDGMSEMQKTKTAEGLLTPPDNLSISTISDLRPTSSTDEKFIQTLYFRYNFPDHFLDIRLLELDIEEVQQIIQQVDLFENVREKLIEKVAAESLCGAALMSCDLSQLRKTLDLNLGNWTIFELLITGLRNIQNYELLKLGMQKQTNLDKGLPNNAVQMIDKNVFEDDPKNVQWSNLSSELQQQQSENIIKDEIRNDLSHGDGDDMLLMKSNVTEK